VALLVFKTAALKVCICVSIHLCTFASWNDVWF